MGSGFPYCRYLEPEDFFGTDYAVWVLGVGQEIYIYS